MDAVDQAGLERAEEADEGPAEACPGRACIDCGGQESHVLAVPAEIDRVDAYLLR